MMNSEPEKGSSAKRKRVSPDDDGPRADGAASTGQPAGRRKRGRHAAACASCHRRKQRCDGAHPCFNCNRRNVGHSCTYTNTPTHTKATSNSANKKSASPYSISSDNRPVMDDPAISHHIVAAAATTTAGATTEPVQAPAAVLQQQLGNPATQVPDASTLSVGDLFKSRDAPSYFGSSYFGPQAAAKIIEAPAPDFASGLQLQSSSKEGGSSTPAGYSTHHHGASSFRDEGGPFSQIWDLLGLLPRKKSTVDRLTTCFLDQLNWALDTGVERRDFGAKYALFWSRKFGFDDFATVDLRWLALLFVVLAYGVLLDCPRPRSREAQREVLDTSLRFYWAARRAIVIAPTFYGESMDLVRAGVLVTRYLMYSRRVPELWLTTSFAMRMAQAQGMHIDGERWRLSPRKTEIRRRLWSTLYTLDKTIALALGRPFAIVDQQCLVKLASNVDLDREDDASGEEAEGAPLQEQPLSDPTPGVGNRLAHELAVIVGKIQERCFGLFAVSYDTVLGLDEEIVAWEMRLPAYFQLHDPDTSKDSLLPWLPWTRLRLQSMYHFARVTLHRPFLLRQSITNRYRLSNDACITSACADLDMRLRYFGQPLADRMKWTLGPHNLFNSALVLGIIVVRDPHGRRSAAILDDLAAYCEMQRNDVWVSEFALAEVKIVELCIRKARLMRKGQGGVGSSGGIGGGGAGGVQAAVVSGNSSNGGGSGGVVPPSPVPVSVPTARISSSSVAPGVSERSTTAEDGSGDPFFGFGSAPMGGNMVWDEQSFVFPETGDILQWEHVLNSIMQDQMPS